MCDYISRDMAIARLTKVEVTNRLATMTDAKREIAEMPAADVVPVVHGEWEAADWREYDANSCEVICYPKDGIACTHCRYVFKKDALWKKNFCPNCGAKMDGGAENG
nr:MAG TPA: DNA-directed RNA polymerase [Caudoviricetes sp.]